MKTGAPVEGDIRFNSLSEVLLSLHKQKETGILTLENGEIKKSIYFEKGDVVFATSNHPEDRLGEKLVQARKITAMQRDESIELSKQESKRHGSVLLELGYIIPKELFLELKNQLAEIVCSLFLWNNGTFSFQENHIVNDVVKLKMDIKHLIQEGNKRRENKENEGVESVSHEADDILKTIKSLDYYKILGIDYKSSLSDVKKAYLKLVQKYHPDRYRHLSIPSLDDKLTVLLGYFNRAHQTLSNQKEKALYDSGLLKKPFVRDRIWRGLKVKEQFRLGIAEYNKGNPWGAADYFRWVTKTEPDKADYWFRLSLALSKIPRKTKEAEEAINTAMQLEPHNADYHVHLGLIYMLAGLKLRAKKQFTTALQWDPTNEKAQKELQGLTMKK